MITYILQSARDFLKRNEYDKAEILCQQALNKEPDNSEVLKLSGIIAMTSGNFERAVQMFSQVILQNTVNGTDYYNLGLAYLNAGESTSAVLSFQKSIKIQPDLACVYADLCIALIRAGDIEAAISAGEKAVSLLPESPIAHYNLAQAYDTWKSYKSAFKHYRKAAELFPNHPGIQLSLATSYLGFGNTEAASICYRKVIKLYPEDVEAYRQLVRINKFSSPDHEDVHNLKLILSASWLNDNDRASVFFALGKIYQDCKQYDDAFSYYQQANKIQESCNRFEPEEFLEYVSAIIRCTDRDILSEKCASGNTSRIPVFIVGVPRSGTSLVEQILSSHHDVFGAGELMWVRDTVNSIQDSLNLAVPYPQCIEVLTQNNITCLAEQYQQYLCTIADDESRVTDKMPNNFLHLGLIHVLFPNARIIHCRRNPRDSCISMYTEYFPDGVSYSYNLLKLGAYYKQYERIMNHWHSVLPAGSIIDVDYENMVADQEKESRRLIDFIGLDWDESCLSFHTKNRRVDTASDLQVKKPIYSSSIGRWKHYEKHLEELERGFKYWECR
ncbi:MAG TPA: sulfotransferase family protein [Crenotrichaceae bacterium]|nr:sulfotransferase family protein [Crenotrichaceae bacterium]